MSPGPTPWLFHRTCAANDARACLDTKLNAMLELGGKGRFHAQLFSF